MARFRKLLVTLISVTCLMTAALARTPLNNAITAADLLKRHRRTTSDQPQSLECVEMTGQEGVFVYRSSGSDAVCLFYVIAVVDTMVQIEMMEFNVRCEGGGRMDVVDGWILGDEMFPSPGETAGGSDRRVTNYCGPKKPPTSQTFSQNAAMIQFRVPQAGDGFKLRVRYLPNPKPCNVIVPVETATMTISNFGSRGNCTAQVIFPVNVRLDRVDIKAASKRRQINGLSVMCEGPRGYNIADIMYGTGFDTYHFESRIPICGQRYWIPDKHISLGCPHSAVRLESAGDYNNSITVTFSSITQEELDDFQRWFPICAPH